MDIPNRILNDLGITLTLTNVMWVALGIAVFVWAVISIVLVYHWVRYGHHAGPIAIAGLIYFLGSGSLLMVAMSSVIYL